MLVTLAPGTPIAFASPTQSRFGLPRSSMSSALRPGLPAPTLASSPFKIWYVRFANSKVVTSSPSRACVHSACRVYRPLPSPSRQTTLRSGQATAAPVATGAAVACPDRKVVCLEGDGSGLYTLQALWTQAREGLDVTTLLFANRTYQILKGELANVGAGNPGRKALDMLDLGNPNLDWVGLAKAMGVPGAKVTNMEEFNRRCAEGLAAPGPYLVEVEL